MEQRSFNQHQHQSFLNRLIASGGTLPLDTPIEFHPYKKWFPLLPFDKCIIGTQPPISYLLDEPSLVAAGINTLRQPLGAGGRTIKIPLIPFYHGNKGSMWEYLLTPAELLLVQGLLEEPNGRVRARDFLIQKLIEMQVNYADIVDSVRRQLNAKGRYDGKDEHLKEIAVNSDLLHHLLASPSAQYLLFNTASIFGNSGLQYDAAGLVDAEKNTKAFDLFVRSLQELELVVEVQIQAGHPQTYFPWTNISHLEESQRKNKVAFELRVINPAQRSAKAGGPLLPGQEKRFLVVTPFSPAAVNRGKTKENLVVRDWLLRHPDQKPAHLLYAMYQLFRTENWAPLFALNR